MFSGEQVHATRLGSRNVSVESVLKFIPTKTADRCLRASRTFPGHRWLNSTSSAVYRSTLFFQDTSGSNVISPLPDESGDAARLRSLFTRLKNLSLANGLVGNEGFTLFPPYLG